MDMGFGGIAGLQRSRGAARVVLAAAGGGRTRLTDLEQRGSARAFVLDGPAGPEIVFLNTSGGLTGGDRLRLGVSVAAGCMATATTQTAERGYRSPSGRARVSVRHRVGAGGRLDWLPQETILFDGAALDRQTVVALEGDASCLVLEAVVLGRAAMGESLRAVSLRDVRTIRRDGKLVHQDALGLDDDVPAAGPAVLQDARALASLVLAGPGAEDAAGPARSVLDEPGVRGGVSAFDGRLSIRLLAGDGWPLRRQILRLLAVLRTGPMPRVWQS